VTPRTVVYWAIIRPALDLALFAAELLAALGIERIGRHRILDHLLNLEASL